MLRATHFILLFVLFACVYAAPTVQGLGVDSNIGLPSDQPIPGPEGRAAEEKSDLEADATGWGYLGYYKPTWGGYSGGWGGRGYGGWGGRGYGGWGGSWHGKGYGWGNGWGNGWGSRYWY